MLVLSLYLLCVLSSQLQSLALRYQAITALRKSLVTAGKALTDTLMKDIIKQSRTALADKCVIIQRAAAEVR